MDGMRGAGEVMRQPNTDFNISLRSALASRVAKKRQIHEGGKIQAT